MVYAPDPALRDEINLRRLVRRLEKSIAEQDWDEPRDHVWIRAQGTLQVNIFVLWPAYILIAYMVV